jgi:hypothetical protein
LSAAALHRSAELPTAADVTASAVEAYRQAIAGRR